MIERRAVTRDTIRAIIGLTVRPDQADLVSPNVKTLAQAPYETGAFVWGLWVADQPVGLMAMVHPEQYQYHAEGDDREAAYLWRLMIAADQQGRGYGRQALQMAVAQSRDWELPRLVASVTNAPHSNLGFYQAFGFRTTGRIVEDEVEIVLDLQE